MIIVCGYGTIGRSAVRELREMGAAFTVVDIGQQIPREQECFIRGDAGREDVLVAAGVADAEAIIVSTGSDATNALIVLMAKTINPRIKALAVVKKLSSIEKLYKAQADYVVSDAAIGGRLVARGLLSPFAGGLMEKITLSKDVEITEVLVPSTSPLVGKTLHDSGIRKETGVNVVILKRDGERMLTPKADTVIMERDRLVVIGHSEGIKALLRRMKEGWNG